MQSGIILNWNDIEPKEFYTKASQERPIFYDESHGSWIIYSYHYCKEVLLNEKALIPKPDTGNKALNANTVLLIQKLARLTNGEQHQHSRNASKIIYNSIQTVSAGSILNSLIDTVNGTAPFDWISVVSKKLPLLMILRGLSCEEEECSYVLDHIERLVKIMLPNKTNEDIRSINVITDIFVSLAQRQVAASDYIKSVSALRRDEWTSLFACNLIGLLIQTYDATRGLLCNSLVQLNTLQRHIDLSKQDKNFFRRSIVETLRFDPPVHNTRRTADENLPIGGKMIQKGENIIIVLAAANLDPNTFKSPLSYDMTRANNEDHLSFGAGGHMCVAKHLAVDIATEVCSTLFQCKHITIREQSIAYEPQLNARLIKELYISVS